MSRSSLVTAVAAAWLTFAPAKTADGWILPNGMPVPSVPECKFPTEHGQSTGTFTSIVPPRKPRTIYYEWDSTPCKRITTYSVVVEPGDTLVEIARILGFHSKFHRVTPAYLATKNNKNVSKRLICSP